MFDVIIIGAGLSGLTTAFKILQKEPTLKLKILEASNTIGGQIAATSSGEVAVKWFSPEQYHIFNLLTILRVPMRRRSPISKSLWRCWTIDEGRFAPVVRFELRRYMDDLDLKSQLFREGTYDLTPEDRDYSMCDHIGGHLFFENSRVFMMNFVRLVAGANSEDISYVEFMNILHSCGGIKTLKNLYIESSPILYEFSSEQLLGALETRLEAVLIKKKSKVTEIQHHQDMIHIRDINGDSHSGRVVVMAIPWNQIVDIFITPPVPLEYEVPYPVSKCFITSFTVQYQEAYWRRRGLSGNFYCAEPTIYAQQYRPTSLSGYILHREGTELISRSIILRALSDTFGEEMAAPVQYNQQTFEQSSLLNLPQTSPWNRLIWSSTSAATLYRGCLSGAVQSGLRAAVHALLILRPQTVTWQDLAEVQKANVVYRCPGCWDLLKSSLNVYNTVFYTAIGLMIYYLDATTLGEPEYLGDICIVSHLEVGAIFLTNKRIDPSQWDAVKTFRKKR